MPDSVSPSDLRFWTPGITQTNVKSLSSLWGQAFILHQFQNTKIVMAFRFKLVKAVSNRFCQVKTGWNNFNPILLVSNIFVRFRHFITTQTSVILHLLKSVRIFSQKMDKGKTKQIGALNHRKKAHPPVTAIFGHNPLKKFNLTQAKTVCTSFSQLLIDPNNFNLF